ncbi:hypothetical protein C8F04DRAFT_1273700 [Mycena alexandri]|uniref:DUF6532 domain-containing protein n=1 Tax=Mycena alexandri TaxID=1745969 RepID=A0AAD6S6U0_9AGAR|nr:hypothetical protein C8F04DRAFT_1273700 [Mycena alexandri]
MAPDDTRSDHPEDTRSDRPRRQVKSTLDRFLRDSTAIQVNPQPINKSSMPEDTANNDFAPPPSGRRKALQPYNNRPEQEAPLLAKAIFLKPRPLYKTRDASATVASSKVPRAPLKRIESSDDDMETRDVLATVASSRVPRAPLKRIESSDNDMEEERQSQPAKKKQHLGVQEAATICQDGDDKDDDYMDKDHYSQDHRYNDPPWNVDGQQEDEEGNNDGNDGSNDENNDGNEEEEEQEEEEAEEEDDNNTTQRGGASRSIPAPRPRPAPLAEEEEEEENNQHYQVNNRDRDLNNRDHDLNNHNRDLDNRNRDRDDHDNRNRNARHRDHWHHDEEDDHNTSTQARYAPAPARHPVPAPKRRSMRRLNESQLLITLPATMDAFEASFMRRLNESQLLITLPATMDAFEASFMRRLNESQLLITLPATMDAFEASFMRRLNESQLLITLPATMDMRRLNESQLLITLPATMDVFEANEEAQREPAADHAPRNHGRIQDVVDSHRRKNKGTYPPDAAKLDHHRRLQQEVRRPQEEAPEAGEEVQEEQESQDEQEDQSGGRKRRTKRQSEPTPQQEAFYPALWKQVIRLGEMKVQEHLLTENFFADKDEILREGRHFLTQSMAEIEEMTQTELSPDFYKKHRDNLCEMLWAEVAHYRGGAKTDSRSVVDQFYNILPTPTKYQSPREIADKVSSLLEKSRFLQRRNEDGTIVNMMAPALGKVIELMLYGSPNKRGDRVGDVYAGQLLRYTPQLIAAGSVVLRCCMEEYKTGRQKNVSLAATTYASFYNTVLMKLEQTKQDPETWDKMTGEWMKWRDASYKARGYEWRKKGEFVSSDVFDFE